MTIQTVDKFHVLTKKKIIVTTKEGEVITMKFLTEWGCKRKIKDLIAKLKKQKTEAANDDTHSAGRGRVRKSKKKIS